MVAQRCSRKNAASSVTRARSELSAESVGYEKGTSTRTNSELRMSPLAQLIDDTAASDCISVDSGGSAAATMSSTKFDDTNNVCVDVSPVRTLPPSWVPCSRVLELNEVNVFDLVKLRAGGTARYVVVVEVGDVEPVVGLVVARVVEGVGMMLVVAKVEVAVPVFVVVGGGGGDTAMVVVVVAVVGEVVVVAVAVVVIAVGGAVTGVRVRVAVISKTDTFAVMMISVVLRSILQHAYFVCRELMSKSCCSHALDVPFHVINDEYALPMEMELPSKSVLIVGHAHPVGRRHVHVFGAVQP